MYSDIQCQAIDQVPCRVDHVMRCRKLRRAVPSAPEMHGHELLAYD